MYETWHKYAWKMGEIYMKHDINTYMDPHKMHKQIGAKKLEWFYIIYSVGLFQLIILNVNYSMKS